MLICPSTVTVICKWNCYSSCCFTQVWNLCYYEGRICIEGA